MNRILLLGTSLLLVISGCAATAVNPPTPLEPESAEISPVDTVDSLIEQWDKGVAASDEIDLYLVTLKLPRTVETECQGAMTLELFTMSKEFAAEATSEVAQVTAETGGARAIDIFTAWTGYVTLIRDAC